MVYKQFNNVLGRILVLILAVTIPALITAIFFTSANIVSSDTNYSLSQIFIGFLLWFLILTFIFTFFSFFFLIFNKLKNIIRQKFTYDYVEEKIDKVINFTGKFKKLLNLGTYFFFSIFETYKFAILILLIFLLFTNFLGVFGFVMFLVILFLPTTLILGILSSTLGVFIYFVSIRYRNGHFSKDHICDCQFTIKEAEILVKIPFSEKLKNFKEKIINLRFAHLNPFLIIKQEIKLFQFAYPYVIRSLTITFVTFTLIDTFFDFDPVFAIGLFFVIYLLVGLPMIFSRRFYKIVGLRKRGTQIDLDTPLEEVGEIVGEPSSKLATFIFYALVYVKIFEHITPTNIIQFLGIIFVFGILIQLVLAFFISFSITFFDSEDKNLIKHREKARKILSDLHGVETINNDEEN